MLQERRQSRRVSITADISYEVGEDAVTKRISDISEGGVFIDTPVPAAVDTELRLRFALEGASVDAVGRVAFSQPYIGMGVEFLNISDEGLAAIREYVAARTEQPVGV